MVSVLAAVPFLLLGAACLLVAYLVGYRAAQKPKICTAQTVGRVTGRSSVTYDGFHLPVVTFTADGTDYTVTGPRFGGVTTVKADISAPGITLNKLIKSGTNLTVEGELPRYIHQKGDSAATKKVLDARYPVGREVPVFYDPAKPKRAFVERYAPLPQLFSLWLPAILGILCIVAGVLFLVLHPFA